MHIKWHGCVSLISVPVLHTGFWVADARIIAFISLALSWLGSVRKIRLKQYLLSFSCSLPMTCTLCLSDWLYFDRRYLVLSLNVLTVPYVGIAYLPLPYKSLPSLILAGSRCYQLQVRLQLAADTELLGLWLHGLQSFRDLERSLILEVVSWILQTL